MLVEMVRPSCLSLGLTLLFIVPSPSGFYFCNLKADLKVSTVCRNVLLRRLSAPHLCRSSRHSSAVSAEDLSAVWRSTFIKCVHMWFNACRESIFTSAPELSVIPQRWSNVSTSICMSEQEQKQDAASLRRLVSSCYRFESNDAWVRFSFYLFIYLFHGELIGPITPTRCCACCCKTTLITVVSSKQGHVVMSQTGFRIRRNVGK